MRNRSVLALIEQAIMLLVFALAAALCLRAFAWADTESERSLLRDMALVQAQNAVEVVKGCGGDLTAAAELWGGSCEGEVWTLCFDDGWQKTDGDGAYTLRVELMDSSLEHLGLASVELFHGETSLAALETAWQEVGGDER